MWNNTHTILFTESFKIENIMSQGQIYTQMEIVITVCLFLHKTPYTTNRGKFISHLWPTIKHTS